MVHGSNQHFSTDKDAVVEKSKSHVVTGTRKDRPAKHAKAAREF
jgi:hypothetical protein